MFTIFFIFNFFHFSDNLRSLFLRINISGFLEKFQNVYQDLNSYFSSKRELLSKNQELEKEIIVLQEKISSIDRLKKENSDLKKIIGLRDERFTYIMAQVVLRDNFDDKVFVNRGKRDGISVGDIVVSPENILVGKIENVFEKNSEVILLANKKMVFGVKIGENGYGVAKGLGFGKLIVEHIPQKVTVKKDDLVFTSSLNDDFPPDLLVGRVSAVEKTDISSFQKLVVDCEKGPKGLINVFIIKWQK